MNKRPSALVVSVLTLCTVAARADVTLPPIISDHMVLQRDVAAPIWGVASPNEEVSVSIAGQEGKKNFFSPHCVFVIMVVGNYSLSFLFFLFLLIYRRREATSTEVIFCKKKYISIKNLLKNYFVPRSAWNNGCRR